MKKIKYLFGPYNFYGNLYLRKRLFHRGYELLKINDSMNFYIHKRHFKNFKEAVRQIRYVYGIDIEFM